MRRWKSRVLLGVMSCAIGLITPHAATHHRGDRSSLDGVSVQLVVVQDPVSFVRSWDAPGRKDAPPIPDVASLKRGSEIGVGVFVSDCPPGSDARCSIVATYSIRTVDGKELVTMPNVPVWRERPPPQGRPELGTGLWRTASEDSDPLGPYIYRAVVRDNVSGKSVTLERKVSLVD